MFLFNKIKKILRKIYQFFFPWPNLIKNNNKIENKIKKILEEEKCTDFCEYMKGFNNISLKEIRFFFERTLQIKKSLEDKLKTSLLSISLGLMILTTTNSLLLNNFFYLPQSILKVIVILGIFSGIYMIIAGFLAINIISSYNIVYQWYPEDFSDKSTNEKKEIIAICTELNSLINIKRQNYMVIIFQNIIISIILYIILFSLLSFILLFTPIKRKKNLKNNEYRNYIQLIIPTKKSHIYNFNKTKKRSKNINPSNKNSKKKQSYKTKRKSKASASD